MLTLERQGRPLTAIDETSLSALEKKLFKLLRDHEGQICTHAELADQLDGTADSKAKLLPVYIGRLRRKLESLGLGTVVSERGAGYRYVQQVPASQTLEGLEPAYARVAQKGGAFFSLANELTRVFVQTIEEIALGQGTTPDLSESALWAAFLEGATESVLATSFLHPSAWWEGRAGQRYLFVNQELARSRVPKVKVRRLYMFDSQAELETYGHVLRDQEDAGIKIKYFFRDKLMAASPGIQRQAEDAWDVAVVDGKHLIQLQRSVLARTLIPGSRFTDDPGSVRYVEESFEGLWQWDQAKQLT